MAPSSSYAVSRSAAVWYWLGSWQDPIRSALALASGLVFYYLLRYEHVTFVTFVACTAALHYVPAICTRFIRDLGRWKIDARSEFISAAHVQTAADNINALFRIMVDIYTFRSVAASAVAFIGLVTLAYAGLYLDALHLFLIGHVSVFTLPWLHARYELEWDGMVGAWNRFAGRVRGQHHFYSIQ